MRRWRWGRSSRSYEGQMRSWTAADLTGKGWRRPARFLRGSTAFSTSFLTGTRVTTRRRLSFVSRRGEKPDRNAILQGPTRSGRSLKNEGSRSRTDRPEQRGKEFDNSCLRGRWPLVCPDEFLLLL